MSKTTSPINRCISRAKSAAALSEQPRKRVPSQIFVRRRLGAWLAASVSVGRQEMIEFKGSHFEWEVILWGVRWYVAYPISYRQLEEMMRERGVEVDHSTLNRWVLKYVPLLDKRFRACKRL